MDVKVSSAHLRSLTSLRFVAAVLVVVFHLSFTARDLPLLGVLMSAGYVGVTFFFVLSGFVLTYSWGSDPRAVPFYRRRFARVYPVHLLFVLVAMLPVSPAPNWAALPANVMLVQAWSSDDRVAQSFTGVSWSLSCEFFFYAVFPLLARWLPRVRRPVASGVTALGGATALGMALQAHGPGAGGLLYHLPAFRFVEFTCGALAATAVLRGTAPRIRIRWASAMVLATYLAVLFVPVLRGYRVEDRWLLTLWTVPSFVALIVACAHSDLSGAPSPLKYRALANLGQWSFCIYMVHPVVITIFDEILNAPSPGRAAVGCVLVTCTVIGFAALIHTAYERPLELWLRGGRARASGEDLAQSTTTARSSERGPTLAVDGVRVSD